MEGDTLCILDFVVPVDVQAYTIFPFPHCFSPQSLMGFSINVMKIWLFVCVVRKCPKVERRKLWHHDQALSSRIFPLLG